MVCTTCLPCRHHENPYRLMPCTFPLDQCLIDLTSPVLMDHQADSIFLYNKHNFDEYPTSVVFLHTRAMHTCFCHHYFLYLCVPGRLGDLCTHGEIWTGQHPPRRAPCSLFYKHHQWRPAHLRLSLVLPPGPCPHPAAGCPSGAVRTQRRKGPGLSSPATFAGPHTDSGC